MKTIIVDDRATHGGSPQSERHYDVETNWLWFGRLEAMLTQYHRPMLYCKGTSVESYEMDSDGIIFTFVGGDGYTYRVQPYDVVYVDYNIKALEDYAAAVNSHLEYLKKYIAGDIVIAYA